MNALQIFEAWRNQARDYARTHGQAPANAYRTTDGQWVTYDQAVRDGYDRGWQEGYDVAYGAMAPTVDNSPAGLRAAGIAPPSDTQAIGNYRQGGQFNRSQDV